jgi:hypothetical protein
MKIVQVTMKYDLSGVGREGKYDRLVLLTVGLNGLGLMYQLKMERDDAKEAVIVVQGQEEKLAAALRRYGAHLSIDKTENVLPPAVQKTDGRFALGDWVMKIRGSQWRGKVVGFYTTDVTEHGYAVESAYETGSVQVWPEAALDFWTPEA